MSETNKIKESRTVPLKDVIYCVIIIASMVASFIAGWNTHVQASVETEARAKDMVTSLTPKKDQQ